jgi:putative ABC transport system substrate-binding protein
LRGLRERGYVEGQNLQIEYRSADGRADRFPDLAAEMVRLPVDLIVTRGTPAAKAAKGATETVPVVMAAIAEPLGVGVVASLAHPGGNVTGLSAFVTELAGKRVELLKAAHPSIARVGLMQNMGNPASPPQWEATRAAAAALGLAAEKLDVRSEEDIAGAFAAIASLKLDALSVGIDALTQSKAETIVGLAAEHKLLTAYPPFRLMAAPAAGSGEFRPFPVCPRCEIHVLDGGRTLAEATVLHSKPTSALPLVGRRIAR